MYYAVKRVINSNPDTLEKQHAEDHAALNSDTQYAELVKQERKAARAYITCMFLFLLAFAATTALSVSPAPASLRIHSAGHPHPLLFSRPLVSQQKERGH